LVCEKIKERKEKDSCYLGVAIAKQDLSICDKIEGQDEKDYCYRDVVAAKLGLPTED